MGLRQRNLTAFVLTLLWCVCSLGSLGCKSTGSGAGLAGNADAPDPAAAMPPECASLNLQTEKITKLIADYSAAKPSPSTASSDSGDSRDSSDWLDIDAERDEAISRYEKQLEDLRQAYETCSRRAASRGTECSFTGAVRASSEEPCQCYRHLTDSFDEGIPVSTAAESNSSCLEYFAKAGPPPVRARRASPTQPQDRSVPKVEDARVREFSGCLCATAGEECVMWRPGEKVAESWIDGPCSAEACHLLSQTAPACALLYRLVQSEGGKDL